MVMLVALFFGMIFWTFYYLIIGIFYLTIGLISLFLGLSKGVGK